MIRILQGDARQKLRELPDASVHCCVTSPPYFGLRSYLPDGHADKGNELGGEASPDAYIAEMVAVFREVRRALRDDGTLWLNLGDSYANDTKWGGSTGGKHVEALHGNSGIGREKRSTGAKPKDLMMMPARVALALQADGWVLRSDIIWQKPNPMPESCSDRPTSSHEHVFLFAKSTSTTYWVHRYKPGTRSQPAPDYRWVHHKTHEEMSLMPVGWDTDERVRKLWRRINLWEGRDYFFDADAVREEAEYGRRSNFRGGGAYINQDIGQVNDAKSGISSTTGGADPSAGRNIRNVWTIATAPFSAAHFATFPPELAERCIKAGTSERGCCANCGAPFVRQTERTSIVPTDYEGKWLEADPQANGRRLLANVKARRASGEPHDNPFPGSLTTGWLPSCQCLAAVAHHLCSKYREGGGPCHPTACDCLLITGRPVPCTVLDPFAGAFTAPMVADRLQRNAIGIELSPSYCEMARARLLQDAGMFAEVAAE